MAESCKKHICTKVTEMLAKRAPMIDKAETLWEAAVLIPLVEQQGHLGVLFEVRSESLVWQPGDVCFPGGKREEGEALQTTAIRETAEELNLEQKDIVVCGELDYLVTQIGPVVHPFVGMIPDLNKVKPSEAEVSEVFIVPLKELLRQQPRKVTMELANKAPVDFPFDLLPNYSRDWNKRKGYEVYFYEYQGHVIWGITARILYGFLWRLKQELVADSID